MRITYGKLEDPSILTFFMLEREGFLPRLRARLLSEVNYRVIYVQDYLVSSNEGWELLEALAKLLNIDYTDLDKPGVACELFSSYLDMKYPTYSYH